MKQHDDCLIEILTEELPPKALLKLAQAFCQQMQERLEKTNLAFEAITYFATPRRLAVYVKALAASTPDQTVERKGPALNAAFDAHGKPSQACVGFARSCGVTPEELQTIKTPQGEWVRYTQQVPGKSVNELMPSIVEQAANALPIPKRMRWGDGAAEFVRPVHAVIMLFGDEIIPATLFGCESGRITRGHRFHAPDWLTIPHAAMYASLLETEGHVIVDFAKRRDMIQTLATECVKKELGAKAKVFISSDDLLNEVTGLVEWPVALMGHFDKEFLDLPSEVLISSMQDHQRYFPVTDAANALLPYFVTMSNIASQDTARVIHGNERVIRARLSDAAFFYQADKQESLAQRLERLKGIVFQAKLGTLFDKAERISQLATFIAAKMQANEKLAARAGLLSKADLTTNMVNEFPELQGVMGTYYAHHDKEASEVAGAIQEHYLPRFAGDQLPGTGIGQVVALADRIDTLVGMFGINQIPTGDKDPFGLRRAALGVLRILIENKIDLDLQEVIVVSMQLYPSLENRETSQQVLAFIQERLRAWYQDQSITPDVFAAVAAFSITNLLDADKRIKAVQAFKMLTEAEALSVANKRVKNILEKNNSLVNDGKIDAQLFENAAEKELDKQLDAKSHDVTRLCREGHYDQVLLQLADLRKPIDDFFDQVMVMTEDQPRRENRIRLLKKLRDLFSKVADIALLQ